MIMLKRDKLILDTPHCTTEAFCITYRQTITYAYLITTACKVQIIFLRQKDVSLKVAES